MEQFKDNQPDKRKGIDIWLAFCLLKLQKKIDAVDKEKQFLLQFSIDNLKAEIMVAREAKEKLPLF